MKKIKGAPKSVLQASKWLEIPMLLTPDDFLKMLVFLEGTILSPLGNLVNENELCIDPLELSKVYANVCQLAFENKLISRDLIKKLSLRIICKKENLIACELAQGRFIVHEQVPAIKMQALFLNYSKEENKIRSRVLGANQIFWGVELSFPQIYQDPLTFKMKDSWNITEESKLFKSLQKWAREHTKPSKFQFDKVSQSTAFRRSKSLDIETYPALALHKICVI